MPVSGSVQSRALVGRPLRAVVVESSPLPIEIVSDWVGIPVRYSAGIPRTVTASDTPSAASLGALSGWEA